MERIKLYNTRFLDQEPERYMTGIDIEGVKWDQWVKGRFLGACDQEVYCQCQDNWGDGDPEPQPLTQGWISTQPKYRWSDDTEVHNVFMCDKHFELLDRMPIYYVTVYECDKAFGGSEEGGWWYTYGEPQLDGRNKCFHDLKEAQNYRDMLAIDLDLDDNKGRRSIDSMASDGEARAIIDADCFPEPFPRRRPHYE